MVNSTLVSESCDDERSFHAQSPNKPLLLARQTAVTMRHPDQCGVNAFQKDLKVSKPSTSIPFYHCALFSCTTLLPGHIEYLREKKNHDLTHHKSQPLL